MLTSPLGCLFCCSFYVAGWVEQQRVRRSRRKKTRPVSESVVSQPLDRFVTEGTLAGLPAFSHGKDIFIEQFTRVFKTRLMVLTIVQLALVVVRKLA